MKKMSIVIVAALSLAAFGCSKKKEDGNSNAGSAGATTSGDTKPASGGGAGDRDACEKAITHSMEVGKADLPTSDAKMMAALHDVGVKHCVEDKWPADAVKCMTDAKVEADGQACYGKLSADQQDKMNKDAMAAASAGSAEGSAAAPK